MIHVFVFLCTFGTLSAELETLHDSAGLHCEGDDASSCLEVSLLQMELHVDSERKRAGFPVKAAQISNQTKPLPSVRAGHASEGRQHGDSPDGTAKISEFSQDVQLHGRKLMAAASAHTEEAVARTSALQQESIRQQVQGAGCYLHMALHSLTRQLFDMSYVDGGCVGDPPPGTMVDNTMGCKLTNYAITLVGVLGAIAIMSSNSADSTYKIFALIFFLGNAFGYGIAGILHQVLAMEAEEEENAIWYKTAYILSLVGSAGYCLIGVQLLIDKCSGLTMCSNALYGFVVVLYVGISVVVGVTYSMQVAALGNLGGLVFVLVVYCCRLGIPKVMATLLMIAGMLTQELLAPTCGNAGYEDCWEDCILPAPQFNHNAAYHALFGIGMLVLAIAMLISPDLMSGYAKLPS